MKKVRKAVTTAIGALITVVGVIVTGDPEWAKPEWITQELVGVVGGLVTTALTYAIPNEPETKATDPATDPAAA